MDNTLAAARKLRGMTQTKLGQRLAGRLGRKTSDAYAQRKIARFENGAVSPTPTEAGALAIELGIELATLSKMIGPRAPQETTAVFDDLVDLPERSLIAACCLSRARSNSLPESYEATRRIVEAKTHLALFIPFPVNIQATQESEHIRNLLAHYSFVRKSILLWNSRFRRSLSPNRLNAVAVYVPRSDLKPALLLPPICRQFALVLRPVIKPDTTKSRESGLIGFERDLSMWTPGIDSDLSRPIKATGVYSIADQTELWECYFGEIMQHWIRTGEFLDTDEYWEKTSNETVLA